MKKLRKKYQQSMIVNFVLLLSSLNMKLLHSFGFVENIEMCNVGLQYWVATSP